MDLRERIITHSGRMFVTYGIRSVTMDSISEELGISKRTLYETFSDKNTLLSEVLLYHKSRQEAFADELVNNADNVIQAMVEIMKNSVENMKRVNPVFFHDLKKYHPDIHESLMKKGEIRNFSITMKILQKGKEQGIFQPDLNLDIVNHTIHTLFDMFGDETKFPLTEYTRDIIGFNTIRPFMKGICTEKGCRLIDEYKL